MRFAAALLMLARCHAQTPEYTYKIVNAYPHDRSAFTQGLEFHDGFLYEGTGLNGKSTLRKVRIEDGHGRENLLTLILEVTGEKKKDKEAKVETARTLWVPAVNNDGRFGRWAFLEIKDPWNAQNDIRKLLESLGEGRAA